MIKLITASERHQANVGDWLKSHYLFSFADHYDPSNMEFGPLRVFNDDYISPKAGFPAHPHTEIEIVTIVLSGELTHKDNIGNQATISPGQVQRMTAGTGMTHSESNETDEEVHLLQLWFVPNQRNLAPSYELMQVDFLSTKNKLTPLVTGQKVLEDVVFLNSNSTVYYGSVDQGEEINFRTFKIRKTLLYLLSGSLLVNNVEADIHDQVRLDDQELVTIRGTSSATFILVDVPALEVNY
ncbi:pirin family protein [Pontibacter sp. JH31]|uniref:Pirin family protein n=1 Tax=Pontibacter aquaedesilientis TaxID=2766980 RepID=A0ABR7XDB9_9BACT|nr:pirin family protein [Pontibacter aquaedesilientis]MBD1396288.1 pirin family protein [Pontibacter aquaedesilientis]